MEIAINKSDLIKCLQKIQNQKLIIMGDIILDHYQWGEVTRISPEAPVPVVFVEKESYSLGGAANVAKNLKALGINPYLVGIVGQDKYGEIIKDIVKESEIECGIVESKQRKTTIKTRVMGNSQQIVRVDMESIHDLRKSEFEAILEKFNHGPGCSFQIISDYGKGMINKKTLSLNNRRKQIIDPKNKNFDNYSSGFIMTPNKKEAEECSGIRINSKTDVIKAGKKIIQKNNLDNLIITLGPDGMVLFRKNMEIIHLKTSAKKVFDVTGAGDTVIAVLGGCLEAGIDLLQSCIIANYAAGIVVGHIGTVSAQFKEIAEVINSTGNPEVELWN